jgi:hypothetical protein
MAIVSCTRQFIAARAALRGKVGPVPPRLSPLIHRVALPAVVTDWYEVVTLVQLPGARRG